MEIHVGRDGQNLGAFSLDEVRRKLAEGTFRPTDLGWTEGQADWVPLASLPALAPPPPPVPGGNVAPPSPEARTLRPAPGVPAPAGPTATSGVAIASLICGILSFLAPLLLSIPAVICGHAARGAISKSGGRLTGAGMALGGLITGYLTLAFCALAILAGILVPAVSVARMKARETVSLAKSKTIVASCQLYAAQHGGEFPERLDELVPTYLKTSEDLKCPLSPNEPVGYNYFRPNIQDPGNKIVLVSKYRNRRGQSILAHKDGSCQIAGLAPPR